MIILEMEQGSPEWFAARAGIPTASCFKYLVTSAGKPSTQLNGYAETLAADYIAGEPVDAFAGNHATQRGTELEPVARNEYEFITGNQVTEIGFVMNDDKTVGCSPDGLVGDEGLIEIKCQLAKGFVSTVANYHKTGNAPPEYYAQIQGQLWLTGRQWCDLVMFHPHEKFATEIIRVFPDDIFITLLETQLKKVIAKRDQIVKHYHGK